jgi:hypothetical protein
MDVNVEGAWVYMLQGQVLGGFRYLKSEDVHTHQWRHWPSNFILSPLVLPCQLI